MNDRRTLGQMTEQYWGQKNSCFSTQKKNVGLFRCIQGSFNRKTEFQNRESEDCNF
jgi:hypothetical protein